MPRPDGRPSPHHLAQAALAALPAAGGARPLHRASRTWLTGVLETPFDGPTVVVTHHAPAWASVAERYRTDRVTAAYASDLSALILATQPALWVHGHIHTPSDYRMGATRVICNPHGYGRENPDFDPALVVEVA